VLYPALVKTGQVKPSDAVIWGSTTGGMIGTIGMEAVFGLVLGFTARIAFDAINFGSNLVGNLMGYGAASMFDPHHETQTQVVAELLMGIAMLLFLALDGHHLMLRAALESYRLVGVGVLSFGPRFIELWMQITAQTIFLGIQIAAPVAIIFFAINLIFGLMAKSMPQMNVLVLSFAVTSLLGMLILMTSLSQFGSICATVFEGMSDWMVAIGASMRGA
jgi:flagellar biosynthetic protein FliR